MLHLSLALAHSPQPKTSLKIPSSSLSLQKLKTLKRHARDDDDGKLAAYALEEKSFFSKTQRQYRSYKENIYN